MLLCSVECRKNTESKTPKLVKTKNGRIILFLNFGFAIAKETKFIKEQKANGLLSSLGKRIPLSKIL